MFLLEPFSFAFIQRAMITGCLVGIACAVLGVFLVLRRLSLIGDGLAHITFGSVALALFGGLYGISMVLVSLPIVVLASLGVLKLSQTARRLRRPVHHRPGAGGLRCAASQRF